MAGVLRRERKFSFRAQVSGWLYFHAQLIVGNVKARARGRIFLARQAKALGLVDEIGGVQDAIAYAAEKGGLQAGDYDVRILPEPKTLGDYLTGNGPDAATSIKPKIELSDPLLSAVSPVLKRVVGRQLQMIRLFQEKPVQLVAPFDVVIK